MGIAAFKKSIMVKSTGSSAYEELPGTSATFNIGTDMLDDTDYTSTGWRSRIAGLKDYSISGDCLYDTSITSVNTLFTAFLNGSKIDFKYLPDGTHGFQGQALVENFNMSGDVAALETFSYSLQSANAGGLSTV